MSTDGAAPVAAPHPDEGDMRVRAWRIGKAQRPLQPIFLGDWAAPTMRTYLGRDAAGRFQFRDEPRPPIDQLTDDFCLADGQLRAIEILLAYYGSVSGYDGDAFVLYRSDGQLYEVNGSHCSCYGLEGQWEPQATSIAALRHRHLQGQLGRRYECAVSRDGSGYVNFFADQLGRVLDRLEKESHQ